MRRFQITFQPSGHVVDVDEGSTILDAARSIDLSLDHVCGGACACATCHVHIKHGLERLAVQSEDEVDMLQTADNLSPLSRLACQTEVWADLIVEIP